MNEGPEIELDLLGSAWQLVNVSWETKNKPRQISMVICFIPLCSSIRSLICVDYHHYETTKISKHEIIYDNFFIDSIKKLSDMSFGGIRVPWNSMEYSMEFHGTNWYFIWRHQSSMEFHGIFHGIPWNTCVICNGALLIPRNPMEVGDFLFGHSRFPWNSMEYPFEVQPG